MRPILVVGSINLDVVCEVDQIPRPGQTVMGRDVQLFHGGKGANQAMGIARLGHPVRMVGRLGDDAASTRLRAGLRAGGVDVRHVAATRRTPSGMALICTDRRGENSIVVSPGANARLTPLDIRPLTAVLRSCAMVLLQLEIPFETVDRVTVLAQRAGVPVMLDPAPARDLPASLLRRVTWLTPNESEAAHLCGGTATGTTTATTTMTRTAARAHAEALRARGCGTAIITLGRQGCCVAAGAAQAYNCARLSRACGGFHGGWRRVQRWPRCRPRTRHAVGRCGALRVCRGRGVGHPAGCSTLDAYGWRRESVPASAGRSAAWRAPLVIVLLGSGWLSVSSRGLSACPFVSTRWLVVGMRTRVDTQCAVR